MLDSLTDIYFKAIIIIPEKFQSPQIIKDVDTTSGYPPSAVTIAPTAAAAATAGPSTHVDTRCPKDPPTSE